MKAISYTAIIIMLICISSTKLQAQNKVYHKSNLFELSSDMSSIIFISFRYDNRFNIKKRLGLGYNIGATFTLTDKISTGYEDNPRIHIFTAFPLGLNYYFGKENNANIFEIGTGITLFTEQESIFDKKKFVNGNSIINFNFMYRYQPVNGGFTWHAGFTPVISTSKEFVPCFTIGIGKIF